MWARGQRADADLTDDHPLACDESTLMPMSGTAVKEMWWFRAVLAEPSSLLPHPSNRVSPYSAGVAMPVQTRTTRLRLRLLDPGDLDIVHPLFSSTGHTVGDGPVANPAWTREWLERRQQRHAEIGLAWYGLWEQSGAFVGTCGAFLGRCGDEPEIGYEIGTAWRSRGFATEAARAVTEAAHAAGHARIWATIRPANLASVRIVRSIGYHLVQSEPDSKGDLDYYLSGAAAESDPRRSAS